MAAIQGFAEFGGCAHTLSTRLVTTKSSVAAANTHFVTTKSPVAVANTRLVSTKSVFAIANARLVMLIINWLNKNGGF